MTVARGETIETIARKYGVPASAIKETNGFRDGAVLRPGQRVVIPRYVTAGVAHAPAPQAAVTPRIAESEHVVAPGESLIGIAHKHGVTLVALAHANNIQPYAKVSIGDRLKIPGGRRVAERQPDDACAASGAAAHGSGHESRQRAGRKCAHRHARDPHRHGSS